MTVKLKTDEMCEAVSNKVTSGNQAAGELDG